LFARFGAPDFGQVSRLACDTQNLSCFEMPLACLHRWSKQGPDRLVRARPLAAAPVIETTRRPHATLDGNTPDQAYFNPLPIRMAA
jgi:hypothetical protein